LANQGDAEGVGGGGAGSKKTSPRSPTPTSGVRRRGAQPGNKQAWKHGGYTKPLQALRARVTELQKRAKFTISQVERQIEARNKEHARHRKRGPRKWVSPKP
jgi:hypothetical protein